MSSSRAAWTAVVCGLLALAAVPLAVLAAQLLARVSLLQALVAAVAAALVLGLVAVGASRRAGFALERSIHATSAGTVRAARLLAWAGVYVGVTAGIALAVYGAIVLWSGS